MTTTSTLSIWTQPAWTRWVTGRSQRARRPGDSGDAQHPPGRWRPGSQLAAADRRLLEQFGGEQFVTALAMRLNLADGQVEVVNAGHPAPWRVRAGRASSSWKPSCRPGMFQARAYRAQSIRLQPADRWCWSPTGCGKPVPPARSSMSSAWPGCCWPPPA